MRCQAQFCVMRKGVRGREFTPKETGIGAVWCPPCIRLSHEVQFFTNQTAEMIRNTYKDYANTNLPRDAKLVLEQFAREILVSLEQEL